MRILIIGGGDLAQQFAHYIFYYDKKAVAIGFVDDFINVGVERFSLPCLGSINTIDRLYKEQKFDALALGIGYSHLVFRKQIFDRMQRKIPFYTFLHPTSFIDTSAVIGEGCFIGPHTIIEQRAVIEHNVFIYAGVNVSHDSKISSHSFIAPSVAIAGFVEIGQCCFIGLQSAIIDGVNITSGTVVGAGALVLNHISEPGLYIGSPARKK